MTKAERLKLLKQIEKDISVCSIESTFLDDAKSCAIHSAIEELEQEPCDDYCVSRQVVKMRMLKYGFHAPDMTVTEFVEDLPLVRPKCKENTVSEEVYTEEYTRRKALEYENYVLKQNMQALRK